MRHLRKTKKYKGGDTSNPLNNPTEMPPTEPQQCKLRNPHNNQRSWIVNYLGDLLRRAPTPLPDPSTQPSMIKKPNTTGGSKTKKRYKRNKKGGYGDYIYLNRKQP